MNQRTYLPKYLYVPGLPVYLPVYLPTASYVPTL